MKKLLIILLTSLIYSGICYAGDSANNSQNSYYPSGFYLGLNLGLAQAQMTSIPDYKTKNSGLGGRTYFGYDFNRNFSLDVGYVLFPQVKYTNPLLPDLKMAIRHAGVQLPNQKIQQAKWQCHPWLVCRVLLGEFAVHHRE